MERERILHTLTLGCKVNQYETEAMEELFLKSGYRKMDETDDFADVYLINTCTVTNLSDRKSRQMIRRAKRENPEAVVCVVGCYAQVKPEEVAALEGVDVVLGTKDREKVVSYCEEAMKGRGGVYVEDISRFRIFQDIETEKQSDMNRAYLKVQDGCNRYCSYCIIPFARGPVRSRPLEDAVLQARRLAENGYKELILTGIHVASYGLDTKETDLAGLIESIAKVDGIERIRLSSMEQSAITREFLERTMATGKLCDHFHLSLQHGSNQILKAMRRQYTAEEFYEKVELIREVMPYVGLSTDIIVGFPGEEERHVKELEEFLKKVEFSRLHVFKYSPRQGTVAAKLPDQVSGEEKTRRSERIIRIGEESAKRFSRKNFGRPLEVLFEEESAPGIYEGYTTNYLRVAMASLRPLKNEILRVKIETEEEPVVAKPWKEE